MKNTWERLKRVLSSCSSQTELLWIKQSGVQDWLDSRESESESERGLMCEDVSEALSRPGTSWVLTVRSLQADERMLNQLSSPDHRDTESDTSSQRPIKTCSVFTNNITIVLQLNTACGRTKRGKRQQWSIVKNVTWFHLWALSILCNRKTLTLATQIIQY